MVRAREGMDDVMDRFGRQIWIEGSGGNRNNAVSLTPASISATIPAAGW